MSIREKAKAVRFNVRRPEEIRGVHMYWDSEIDKTINPLDSPNNRWQEAFHFRIGIETIYWANEAERQSAHAKAANVCTSVLFEDVAKILPRLRHAIYNRDFDEAMRLVGEIQDEITW